MTALPDYAQALGDGVHAIDTGFQRDRFDAAYLLVDAGRAAFIDTGTAFAVPRLLATLECLGLPRDAVDWVIPTHVHLDHAGGVGQLMQALPAARLMVHPRGARHMIDPAQLWAGALAVYGAEEMARSYDKLVGVAAERVSTSEDGLRLPLGSRTLRFADTPGHARHHHCIWDETTRGWFTGDTFGISYREFDSAAGPWIFPTSTPVQFEPEALRDSVQRLLAARPACLYLTHFGRVDDVARLGTTVLALLDAMVTLGHAVQRQTQAQALAAGQRHAALKDGLLALYGDSLRAHGCPLSPDEVASLLAIDVELNAQGMAVWLDRVQDKPR